MKREDFVCAVGFDGNCAIVDGSARRRYGALKVAELLDKGLYRYAFRAALYDGSLEDYLPRFVEASGIEISSIEALKRLFGVFEAPDDSISTRAIS